jgi:hypothetical protein
MGLGIGIGIGIGIGKMHHRMLRTVLDRAERTLRMAPIGIGDGLPPAVVVLAPRQTGWRRKHDRRRRQLRRRGVQSR